MESQSTFERYGLEGPTGREELVLLRGETTADPSGTEFSPWLHIARTPEQREASVRLSVERARSERRKAFERHSAVQY